MTPTNEYGGAIRTHDHLADAVEEDVAAPAAATTQGRTVAAAAAAPASTNAAMGIAQKKAYARTACASTRLDGNEDHVG